MKIIKKLIIRGKEAKLILLDDNKTVNVVYDNETISSSAGGTWNNIQNDEWAQQGLLSVEVEGYIKKKESMNKLQKLAEEYF